MFSPKKTQKPKFIIPNSTNKESKKPQTEQVAALTNQEADDSYARGYHEALTQAKSLGWRPCATDPPKDTRAVSTRTAPPVSLSNVQAYTNGYYTAMEGIEKICYEAFVKGDKTHFCGLTGCGENLSPEQEARIKELHRKMDLLSEKMGELVKELESMMLEGRERK